MAASFAGILGPTAFAVIVIRGLMHARGANATLVEGSLALFLFAAVGWIVGAIAKWSVEDSVYTRIAAEVDAQASAAKPSST